MKTNALEFKETRAYLFLTALVICGLAASLITAPKIVHVGINFPFSNIVFSIFTYPIVDCICELWGKPIARQTVWIGLVSQVLFCVLIQLSILAPPAQQWLHQGEYQIILSTGINVVIASLVAFAISQIFDIYVYQKLKEKSLGKQLWLRSNLSTYLGQTIDSILFINIVFYNSNQKMNLILGSITIKIILSFLMTPIVYLIIHSLNRYLDNHTLAFKMEGELHHA
ncbi:MAG: VUT family protein [Legionella sp.]|nr:MAG: VUT family protein [Legionella sp.]